jgi:hypothetical protein
MALGLNEESEAEKKGRVNAHHDPAVLDAELLERGLVVDGHLLQQARRCCSCGTQRAGRGETEGGRARGGFWWKGREEAAELGKQEGKEWWQAGRIRPGLRLYGMGRERADPSM